MECWNIGILGIRLDFTYFNCYKIPQSHNSITPLFHYSSFPSYHAPAYENYFIM